jgi:hypothetical protein
MFFLWMFGYRVENTFGRGLFLLVYILCGFGAAGAHYLFNFTSSIPCVGASGAISGVVGCYFVLFPNSRFDLEIYFFRFNVKTIQTRTHGAVGAWLGEQAILGLITQAVQFSSVAFWAHLGGFATGAALTGVLSSTFPHLKEHGDQPYVVRSLKGKVFDVHGKTVANAQVTICGDDEEVRACMTNSNGTFAIDDLADGVYSFEITANDGLSAHGNVIVNRKLRFRSSVPLKIHLSSAKRTELAAASGANL